MTSTKRLAGAVAATALVVATVSVPLLVTRRADADIESTTFTSKSDNVRVTLPRGWRWSDQPSYPGVVLRMNRTRPRGTMILAVQAAPTSIDPACRNRPASEGSTVTQALPPEMQIACVEQKHLEGLGFDLQPIKEAQRPWFDYASKTRSLRQGIVVVGQRVFTLVLSTDTPASRAQHARTFDSTLRSIRALAAPGADTDAGTPASTTTSDGGVASPEVDTTSETTNGDASP